MLIGWVARMFGRREPVHASDAALPMAREKSAGTYPDLQLLLDQAEECLNSGRYRQAQEVLTRALSHKHDAELVHYKLGLAFMRQGRIEDAADSFVMALCFAPQMPEAHFALALAERKQGKRQDALASVARAIECGLSSAEAHNLRGALLLEMGDITGAVASFKDAIAADPNCASAHSNLGYVLFRDRGEYDDGTLHIERALELDPNNADSLCNYTMVLMQRGEHERALALCNQLLSARPELHEARLNRAQVLLTLGRFEAAWDDYEVRKTVRSNFVAREFPCLEWRGEDLGGKTLLVHGEQGLGDEIMFASCFGDLMRRPGRYVIECEPRLAGLFRRSFSGASVFPGNQSASIPAWWTKAPTIDLHVPAGSLPQYFRRSSAAFPAHQGYLIPEPERIAHWRSRLANLGPGLKIGISWRGGTLSTRGSLRSIGLAAWAPLFRIQGVHIVSLQYGDNFDERERFVREHGVELPNWLETGADLDDTAALIAGLDLVISVCTAVIHLAGAIGRPVWVLVPTRPEWRYQASGETVPWYPSARLVRQQIAGDWEQVIAEVANRLRELTRTRGHRHAEKFDR